MFTDDMSLTEAYAWERLCNEGFAKPGISPSEREQLGYDLEDVQARIADLQDRTPVNDGALPGAAR